MIYTSACMYVLMAGSMAKEKVTGKGKGNNDQLGPLFPAQRHQLTMRRGLPWWSVIQWVIQLAITRIKVPEFMSSCVTICGNPLHSIYLRIFPQIINYFT